jgi:2-polyprenyl-6-methoxyphenol hydroxylase-like FAD-dependent oxidoreductase
MRIGIVGGGPAGAALSLLLARNGIEVTLIERESDSARVFRGEGLMPTGLDALYQMGLRDEVVALPGSPVEYWQINLNRRPVIQLAEPAAEFGDRAFRTVAQPPLLDLLIREGGKCASFEFRPGCSVRGLLRSDDDRVRGIRVSDHGTERELEFDWVIGADGRGSTVRKRANLALDLLPESYDVLQLKTAVPPELKDARGFHIYAAGPDAALSYRAWDGAWQIAWMLPKGSWPEMKQRDWLAELAALMPPETAEHLLATRDAIEGPLLLDVIVGRCPTWHAPGVLLIGDAAHPMSPIRAQGINMALRDAIVTANHLVPAIREGPDLSATCAAIQEERRPEIVKVQKLQLREVRGQRWARQTPWLMNPLLKLAPLIAGAPGVEASWNRQQRPFRRGITQVELRV